jgi:hypothetical protein
VEGADSDERTILLHYKNNYDPKIILIQTRVKGSVNHKHTSLLHFVNNYGRKRFYDKGPGDHTGTMAISPCDAEQS